MKSPATTKRPGDFASIQACDPARQNRRVDSGLFGRLNAVGNRFQFGAIGFFAIAGAPIIQQQELGRRIGLDERQADIGRAILVLAGEGQVERASRLLILMEKGAPLQNISTIANVYWLI
jgi:hypothetical protein